MPKLNVILIKRFKILLLKKQNYINQIDDNIILFLQLIVL